MHYFTLHNDSKSQKTSRATFSKRRIGCQKIADTLNLVGYENVLEIGPGMGVLTKYLLEKPIATYVVEIDTESVDYLNENYPKLKDKIIAKDF